VAQEAHTLVADVVGDRDHALVVEEVGGATGDELDVGAVVDACLTPPFLIDQRVIVVRDAGRLVTSDAPRLVEVIANPLPTTVLVLIGGSGTIPAPLVKAVKEYGQVLEVATGKTGERKAWLAEHLRDGPVRLDKQAADVVGEHLGEDLGRLQGLLSALGAAYGEDVLLTADDVAPYLGQEGNVPRWDLTDAIDGGRTADALRVLQRMLGAGGLHPIQVMATLHGHYANMLALDGEDVRSEGAAASILGIAPFTAKKALAQSRKLGSEKIAQAMTRLATADLDLRGASGLPAEVVIEILVARLASQTRPVSRGAGTGTRRAS
jgi:DNA polymerase-3 subunit delta